MTEPGKKKFRFFFLVTFLLTAPFVSSFFANRYRVLTYESRISELLEHKSGNWYLPRSIPRKASQITFDDSDGFLQGSSKRTLKFRLPEKEAIKLLEELDQKFAPTDPKAVSEPEVVSNGNYRNICWSSDDQNHGSQGGVWFDPQTNNFVFHHEQW